MSEDIQQPCELLTWDSAFFGFRVARLRGDVIRDNQTAAIDTWCCDHDIALLYVPCDSTDPHSSRAAEAMGAHLVDVRVTLGRNVQSHANEGGSVVRQATIADIPRLQQIARVSHKDTRFYLDLDFPAPLADALYERWIQASFEGFADIVLVTDRGSGPISYITCRADLKNKTGNIGLFAVSPEARGQGVATDLISCAMAWFAAQQMERVTVVTQGRNVAAQRLYERAGFLLENSQLYYHKWYLNINRRTAS